MQGSASFSWSIRCHALASPNHCADGLLRQLFPVNQEKKPLRAPRLEHPLAVEANHVRLAGACREFDEETPLAEFNSMVQRAKDLLLIRSDHSRFADAKVIVGNRNGGQRLGFLSQIQQPLQVAT